MSLFSFDNRPEFITPSTPIVITDTGTAADGNIHDTTLDIELQKEADAQKQAKKPQTLGTRLKIFFSTTAGVVLLVIGSLTWLIDAKKVKVDGKQLTFNEKLYYYGSRPYRLISDTETATHGEKVKKEFKESF